MFRPAARIPARPLLTPSALPTSRSAQESQPETRAAQRNGPPPIPTRDEQAEYIRKLQTEKAEIEKQLAESRLKNLKDRHHGRGRKSKANDGEISTLILRFAKRYVLCGQAWLPLSTHQLALARPPMDYTPSTRYSDGELNGATSLSLQEQNNRADGMLWELYSLLPEGLEEEDLSKTFFEKVNAHMSDYRSHIQNRLRTNIQMLLRDLAPLSDYDLAKADDTEYRSTSPVFLQLQGYTEGLNEDGLHYPLMPPILLGGSDTDPIEQRWFKNPLIERVLVLILLGPAALKAGKPWKRSSGSLADLLGIDTINASLLAFAATLSRFLISPEKEFSMKVRGTGVQWPTQYEQYKMLLWDDSAHFQPLFEQLNHSIFGTPMTVSCPGPALVTVSVTTNQLQILRRILAEEQTLRASADNSTTDHAHLNVNSSREHPSEVPSPSPLHRIRQHRAIVPATAPFSTPCRIGDLPSNAVTPSNTSPPNNITHRISPRLSQRKHRLAKENALASGHVESEEEVPAAPLLRIRQKKQRNKLKNSTTKSKGTTQPTRPALAPLNHRPITRSRG